MVSGVFSGNYVPQQTDYLNYQEHFLSIIEPPTTFLFDLSEHGIQPEWRIDNHRGYTCVFKVFDDQLFLTLVKVNFGEEDVKSFYSDQGPTLFGIKPTCDEIKYLNYFAYEGLMQNIHYTGKIKCGEYGKKKADTDVSEDLSGFIQIYELNFVDGILESVKLSA